MAARATCSGLAPGRSARTGARHPDQRPLALPRRDQPAYGTGIPADRPFHSLSYPDIDYTIMRPAALPPSPYTNPVANLVATRLTRRPSTATVTSTRATPACGIPLYFPYSDRHLPGHLADGHRRRHRVDAVGGWRDRVRTRCCRRRSRSRRLFQIPDVYNPNPGTFPRTQRGARGDRGVHASDAPRLPDQQLRRHPDGQQRQRDGRPVSQ